MNWIILILLLLNLFFTLGNTNAISELGKRSVFKADGESKFIKTPVKKSKAKK